MARDCQEIRSLASKPITFFFRDLPGVSWEENGLQVSVRTAGALQGSISGPLSKPLFFMLMACTKVSPGHTDGRGRWTEARVLREETRREVRKALTHKRGRGSAQRGTCCPASRVV